VPSAEFPSDSALGPSGAEAALAACAEQGWEHEGLTVRPWRRTKGDGVGMEAMVELEAGRSEAPAVAPALGSSAFSSAGSHNPLRNSLLCPARRKNTGFEAYRFPQVVVC